MNNFVLLDDTDIWGSIKIWIKNEDFVLRKLSLQLIDRSLLRLMFRNEMVQDDQLDELNKMVMNLYNISESESTFFNKKGTVSNSAYVSKDQTINILTKSGKVLDVANATDLPNIKAMSKIVTKHYLSYPKELSL